MTNQKPETRNQKVESQRFRDSSLLVIGFWFLVSGFWFEPAHASIPPTALTGHVTSAGAPVAGATVTATSNALPSARTTTTTTSGMYWLEDLPPGVYDVTFAHAGMTTLTRRAVIELARVSRADATLVASEEEDSVTSTATSITVADTQPVTVAAADHELDLLPIWRNPGDAAFALAGSNSTIAASLIDDASAFTPFLLGQEALEEVTVIRGAAPSELGYGAIVAKTRSGGDDFFISLRDTLTSTSWIAGIPYYDEFARKPRGGGVDHFVEGALGGPISREHLWFFASAWRGGEDDRALHNVRGYEAKLTSQLGAAHTLTASYIGGTFDTRVASPRAGSQGTLRYTGIATPQTTLEAIAARSTFTFTPSIFGTGSTTLAVHDSLFVKASHASTRGQADSVWSGGVEAQQGSGGSATLFANERWARSTLVINAGGRLERGGHEVRVRPRLGVTWDLRGDGKRALFAGFSDYADAAFPAYSTEELIAGYASAIGASGLFRVDGVHRRHHRLDEPATSTDILRVESSYRLFERFVAGGFYEYGQRDERAYPFAARHSANAWLSAELPLANHELSTTLLERFVEVAGAVGAYQSDLALRYTVPFRSITLTTAADIVNVFNASRGLTGGRTLRVWLRMRH